MRDGLRHQPVLDLHDYHDFHRSSEGLLGVLESDIADYVYRPKRAQPIRLEKAAGVSRILHLLAPEDAVVLQTIVEVISPEIKGAQPSKNAFYSRSHGHVENPGALDDTFGYMWWQMWPEFQSRILGFTKDFPCLVVTDIADYFDSIPLSSLRNALSSIARFDQELLDLLFLLLGELASRAGYLPPSGTGLPQIDFDAPRLLGHAYLFEADKLLQERTGDNFVRWMDDINVGVESEERGRRLIAELDQVLRSRGLRVNLAKTRILTASLGAEHFAFAENQYLTLVGNALQMGLLPPTLDDIHKRFRRFWRHSQSGSRNKVLKRYIGLFSQLQDPAFVKYAGRCLGGEPELRDTIFRYYVKLGYTPARYEHLRKYVLSECVDDTSLFGACKVLVDWDVPKGMAGSVVSFARRVADREGVMAFVAATWLLAKYAQAAEIESFLKERQSIWRRNWFAARQVAALTPRLTPSGLQWLSDALRASGQMEAIRVLANVASLRRLSTLTGSDRSYLSPTKFNPPYPFAKVLIALAVLSSSRMPKTELQTLGSRLLAQVRDRTCREYIRQAGDSSTS